METIPDLAFEIDGDQINLEQGAGLGEVDRVTLHRIHLLHLAQRFGLIREMSASEADEVRTDYMRAATLLAYLEGLIPWLEIIETRASQLYENILSVSSLGHEDLNVEIAQASALADIAEQVLEDAKAVVTRGVTRSHDVSRIEQDCNPITPDALEAGGPVGLSETRAAPDSQARLL
jgi:hypothetical protein